MKELIELLSKSGRIALGGKADVHHNIDARHYLAEENMAIFPDDFFSLVKYANGIRGDAGEIYAILPEGNGCGFSDAVRINEDLARPDRATVAVLGKTEFDYLVYDSDQKLYQLRDRIDDCINASFGNLATAIRSIFTI